jgi:dipeptidase D
MANKVIDLNPQIIWNHFYNLTQIPRPSGHEAKVVEHIKQFAERQGLPYIVDDSGNIIVRKEAHNGSGSKKTVVLQSHVDMVPQKNSDKVHNFETDPIETIVDGEWVRANKTTLGADNGIGVATTLALLESQNIKHGPIEALFTISEETGMNGAFGLKPGILKGDILLNLDSEEEGELIAGCAGGLDANINYKIKTEEVTGLEFYSIDICGLKGGHSGVDIILERGNANKLLVELLIALQKESNIRLASFSGGNLRNAIPREATAIVGIDPEQMDNVQDTVKKYYQLLVSKFEGIEDSINVAIKPADYKGSVMMFNDQEAILNAIENCPNGVIKMSPTVKGVVQTSTNLSIINIRDGIGEIKCLLRSSNDAEKKKLSAQMEKVFKLIGAEVVFEGEYPGWQPNMDSYILSKAKEIYKSLYRSTPDVKVIHAGLECGIIGAKYPGMEMVSFGPTIKHPHSPDEKVNIKSVGKFWDYFVRLMESI